MKLFKILHLLCVVCWAVALQAQNVSLDVQIGRDTVLMGNQVSVTFTIHNATGTLDAPVLDGLNIVSGPSTAFSHTYINGTGSRKSTYTYLLEPTRLGPVTISGIRFQTEEIELTIGDLNIYVLDNPDQIKQDPGGGQTGLSQDIFTDFGSFRDIFEMPHQIPVEPKEPSPAPGQKSFKFKTEKI